MMDNLSTDAELQGMKGVNRVKQGNGSSDMGIDFAGFGRDILNGDANISQARINRRKHPFDIRQIGVEFHRQGDLKHGYLGT